MKDSRYCMYYTEYTDKSGHSHFAVRRYDDILKQTDRIDDFKFENIGLPGETTMPVRGPRRFIAERDTKNNIWNVIDSRDNKVMDYGFPNLDNAIESCRRFCAAFGI